jgi:hypothetical protein
MTFVSPSSTAGAGASSRTRFTKELRQRLVREFAERNGGIYDAKLFEREVRNAGPAHEAYEWFTWDEETAALQYRIDQAREFAIGLKIVFTVEEIGRNRKVVVVERDMPFAMSPLDGRLNGGGYYLTDPKNEDHVREHCRQAAASLRTWQARYSAAAASVGMSTALDRLIAALDAAS